MCQYANVLRRPKLQRRLANMPNQTILMKTLRWKNSFFSNTWNLTTDEILVGFLKENDWKQTALGELNGKKFNFATKGFFSQETQVFDADTAAHVATISYNSWHTKASIITPGGKIFTWRYDNAWNTKWSISDASAVLVKYTGSITKGTIESAEQDEMLLLSGLFITNYYWQITVAVMIAIFIPIFAS
jgi:hypothetical protein